MKRSQARLSAVLNTRTHLRAGSQMPAGHGVLASNARSDVDIVSGRCLIRSSLGACSEQKLFYPRKPALPVVSSQTLAQLNKDAVIARADVRVAQAVNNVDVHHHVGTAVPELTKLTVMLSGIEGLVEPASNVGIRLHVRLRAVSLV
jgi:hypothetical protein